jgi:Gas vesicle synthesis protein GvpL/GvpF
VTTDDVRQLVVAAVETYVYGVVRAGGGPVPETRGIGPLQAPLRTVTHGALKAVISDVPAGELGARREDIYRHTEILEALMRGATVLPMRFGTIMPDEQTVAAQLLEARGGELEHLLEALDGRVELTLRATYDESIFREVVSENPPIQRLNERVQAQSAQAGYYDRIRLGELVSTALQAKRERDAAAILGRLEPLAADMRIGSLAHERSVLNAAFLVEERAVERFDAAADAIAAEHAARMRFRYTGPVPPYSFVELSEDKQWV